MAGFVGWEVGADLIGNFLVLRVIDSIIAWIIAPIACTVLAIKIA